MNDTIIQSFKATGYGMGGVFLVLILFYLLTKLMLFVFRGSSSDKDWEPSIFISILLLAK